MPFSLSAHEVGLSIRC